MMILSDLLQYQDILTSFLKGLKHILNIEKKPLIVSAIHFYKALCGTVEDMLKFKGKPCSVCRVTRLLQNDIVWQELATCLATEEVDKKKRATVVDSHVGLVVCCHQVISADISFKTLSAGLEWFLDLLKGDGKSRGVVKSIDCVMFCDNP